MECDVPALRDGDLSRLTVVDTEATVVRKSVSSGIFIVIGRIWQITGVTAVNRRVAGSSPARGANLCKLRETPAASPPECAQDCAPSLGGDAMCDARAFSSI